MNLSRVFVRLMLLVLLPAHAVLAEIKVATLDLAQVFDGYWRTSQAASELKDRAGEFKKQLIDLNATYQKDQELYRNLLDSANDQALTEEERAKRKKNAAAKSAELQELKTQMELLDQTAREALDRQYRHAREVILKEIHKAVAAKAQAADYNVVLDSSSPLPDRGSSVLFCRGVPDLSQEILGQLNKNAPSAFLHPAEPKSENGAVNPTSK